MLDADVNRLVAARKYSPAACTYTAHQQHAAVNIASVLIIAAVLVVEGTMHTIWNVFS